MNDTRRAERGNGGRVAEDTIERILGYTRRIAVVGLSDQPWRASHDVAASLRSYGYEIVPVNPHIEEALGARAYPSLGDVPGDIDLVDVFRRREHLPEVAREAVEVGARGIWFQLGLRSPEARRIAEEGGLDVVEDRCLKIDVARYARSMQLPASA